MQIYLFDGKTKLGPFSEEELRNLTIAPGTLFWYDGLSQWLPIEKLHFVKVKPSFPIEPYEENEIRKIRLLWASTIFIFLAIIALYAVFFNEFSETELVEISFYWFGPIVFCITALIAAYKKRKKALLYGLIAGIISTLLLILFFASVWSAL